MRKCVVCNGSDFSLHEGHYYCIMCHTQSQDIDEDVGIEYFSAAPSKTKYHLKTIKRKRVNTEADDPSWTTFDACNVILKKQVDKLILLGATPQLQGTVLRLWISYLECVGVAFLTKPTNDTPKLAFYPRKRDIFALLQTHGISVPTVKKQSSTSLANDSFQTVSMGGSNTDSPPASSFGYLSDYSDRGIESSPDNDSISEVNFRYRLQKKLIQPSALKLRSKLQRTKKKNKRIDLLRDDVCSMRLCLTIPFLYLGLLLLNEQIGLSDLIRWISEEQIPFYGACQFLPSYMKFKSKEDIVTFHNKHALNYETIQLLTGKLAKLLSIHTLPVRPIHYIAARVVKDLSLPASLCSMVYNLMSVCPPLMTWSHKSYRNLIPNYEGRAVAYLIVALKLIFCLDGETEQKLSKFSQLLNERKFHNVIEKKPLFVYGSWRKQNSVRQAFQLMSQQRIKRDQVMNVSADVDILMGCFNSNTWKITSKQAEDANTKWERYYEVLSQPFRSLTSHTSVLSSTNVASASSFPLLSESEAAFSKCSNSSDSKLRTSEDVINFSESTFETAALNFLNICNLQASFLSSTLPCNSGNNYNGKDLRLLIESYSQWLSSSKRYHINHLSKATEKHLSQTAGALGALPFSVTWLIETCAKLLEMKPALLCQEVVNVERDLLTACCKLKIY